MIAAIIVTYRREAVLAETLLRLAEQSRPPDACWLVDNSPSEQTRSLATTHQLAHIELPDNLGPAGALSIGMTQIVQDENELQSSDWLLVVDDDDPPPYNTALEELLAFAAMAPPNTAAVGLTGARFDSRSGRTRRVVDDELADITDVDYIGNGQCVMYRVGAVREVGVPDERLFFGFEELEYGLRLKSKGWRLLINRAITERVRHMHHRQGLGQRARSGSAAPPWRRYYSARNSVLISKLYGTHFSSVWLTAATIGGGSRAALRERSSAALVSTAQGLLHGWLGRTGRTREPVAEPSRRAA